jgi:drug/metabolite transporter (DMT)-like permease
LFLLIVNIKNGTIKELGKYSGKDYAIMAGLGFIGLFLYSGLYYYGLTQLSSQEACIVNYLWPMMLVLFSTIILKEKLTVVKAVAMISSFIGVVILSVGSGSSGNGNVMLGIGSCVIAAACYGLFSVLNKKANYDQNIAMMVMWLIVAVCSAVFGLAIEDWKPVVGVQWLGMLWMGVVVNAIAYLIWALALNADKNSARIANLAYLTPFLSLIISAVVLKEQIQGRALIAFVFIIGGILLQTFWEHGHSTK